MTTRHTYLPLRAATPRATVTQMLADTTETYSDGIDWIAVERAAEGTYDAMLLTPDEKCQAALLMIRAGHTSRDVSTRLCVYQRQVERWKTGMRPRGIAECGTRSGYRRHKRLGETPDQACIDAYRAYNAKQRQEAA